MIHMSIIIPILLRSAEQHVEFTEDSINLQRRAMLLFFDLQPSRPGESEILLIVSMRIASSLDEIMEVCSWKGIACQSAIVRSIEWDTEMAQSKAVRLARMHVRWLPPTVHRVFIANQYLCQASPADTRHFPREAVDLSLKYCSLVGSLDMTALPRFLERLDLSGNPFHGEVVLTDLPENLRTINLGQTDILSVLVDNASLPSKFRQCVLSHWNKKVYVRTASGAPVDSRFIVERIGIFGKVYI